MTHALKLCLAGALGLGLTHTAVAQSTAGGSPAAPDASATGTGTTQDIASKSWNTAVRDVFFTDATMTEIRPAEDIEPRWAALSTVDKEAAQRDCAAYLIDAGSMGGAGGPSNGDTSDTAAAAGQTETGGTSNAGSVSTDTTTASDAPASPGDSTLWNQACSLVQSYDPE